MFKEARILIVDDQQANIDLLSGLLDIQGYTNIKTTTDSRMVVSLFKSFAPDLILLDLMMPYFTGFDVLGQLKELIPENSYLPILVLTADISSEAKKRALFGGARDFLSKPFDMVEVALRIDNLLFARYLYNNLQNENRVLEERVRERTAELEVLNAELLVATEKVETSDRLKSVFIRNLSHEIRTPLNGILGMYQVLTDPALTSHDKDENLVYLRKSSNRLIRTVTDMMDISLIVSDNMPVRETLFDPAVLVEKLFNSFKTDGETGNVSFKLQSGLRPGSCQVKSDPDLLLKALSPLIDNALKFTGTGQVVVGLELKDRELLFSVRDTGIGIDAAAQALIFEPFMQENILLTRGHEGNGLGLSIASGLADILGGRISLESVKGEGSAFFFNLPAETFAGAGSMPGNAQTDHAVTVLPAILITDDDVLSRKYLEFILNDQASAIFQAKNGREAVDICREHPEINLVMMDLKMPVMNGFEATREIRKFNTGVVIIVQTAYDDQEVRETAHAAGCNDFITKPVDEVLLLKLMASYFSVS